MQKKSLRFRGSNIFSIRISFLISTLVPSLVCVVFFTACSGDDLHANSQNAFLNTAGSTALGAKAANVDCANISLGQNGDLNDFTPMSTDSEWNQNIASLAAVANSDALLNQYIQEIGENPPMHGDFSSVAGETYNVVDSSVQPLQNIDINGYVSESDIMPVPLPNSAVIEGGSPTCAGGGDCHLLVLDRSQCWLYETWLTTFDGSQWHASNMAVWDLLNPSARPYGWTSADAAGLSVFAGLLRYDEVAKGAVTHAIRFTLSRSANAFVTPASHSAGSDSNSFPMGTRFRLKASFDISGFSPVDQIILTAMKNYGLILADNGTDLEVAGTNDARWSNSDVVGLKAVHLTDFEIVSSGPVMSRSDLPTGAGPSIDAFSASSVDAIAGDRVTLNWQTSNDSWNFIDVIGPVRGNSVEVAPTATTIYTLNSTNAFGRTTQSVTVQVH